MSVLAKRFYLAANFFFYKPALYLALWVTDRKALSMSAPFPASERELIVSAWQGKSSRQVEVLVGRVGETQYYSSSDVASRANSGDFKEQEGASLPCIPHQLSDPLEGIFIW